jgi:hypothetical protein
VAFSPGAVAAADCSSQAAALLRAEADLPRISAWDQTRTDYAKLFGKHRCRRAL